MRLEHYVKQNRHRDLLTRLRCYSFMKAVCVGLAEELNLAILPLLTPLATDATINPLQI